MLGRLFSSSFSPSAGGGVGGSSSGPGGLNNNHNNSSSSTTTVSPQDGNTPLSMLEEADTRGLLYGSSMKSDLKIEPSKDIRVVVLSDIACLDDLLFDSVQDQSTSRNASTVYPPLVRAASYMGPEHQQRASSAPPSSLCGPESLPLPLLKELLFGPTPIHFHSSVTKLHPFPSTNPEKPNRKTWLVSKLFKIGQNDLLDKVPTKFISEYKSAPTKSANHPLFYNNNDSAEDEPRCVLDSLDLNSDEQEQTEEASRQEEEEDAKKWQNDTHEPTSWNPKNCVNYKLANPMSQDVGCGICVFFNLPSDDESLLTNHWEELSIALADLQKVIFNRLAEILPGLLREYKASKKNLHGRTALCNGDEGIRNAVDFFRTRFYGVLRIPRVICGQDRWSELFEEIKWVYYRLNDEQQEDFLSSVLSTFIRCNPNLVTNSSSKKVEATKVPPTRTIIVGNNRITTRKLIFILTSLIHDLSTKRWNEKLDRLNNAELTDEDGEDVEEDGSSTIASKTDMSSASSSPASRSHAVFTESGWEIPTSSSRTGESASACTMPHVVRPSFSSSSLSNEPRPQPASSQRKMRYPSFEGLRKSFGSSSGNSIFSSLWSSAGTSFTSNDSFFQEESQDGAYDDLPNSLPISQSSVRPSLNRWNSSERTATTLSPSSNLRIPRTATNDSICSSANSGGAESTNSELNFEYVQDDGVDVLEVAPLDPPELERDTLQPIVLPPIAGFIPDFHPDFDIQAVPLNRDLEEKIARTMVRDADVVPIPHWASNVKSADDSEHPLPEDHDKAVVLSRSLIVNLRKREIYEWSLTRQCTHNGCKQELVRRKLYSGRKAQGEYGAMAHQVASVLKEVVTNNKGDHIRALKKAYQCNFNLA